MSQTTFVIFQVVGFAKIRFLLQWCDMKTVYLDYASTAPRNADILHAKQEFELSHYANVGRGLYTLAEDAEGHYQASKKAVAEWVGCEPVEVLYTYSATYGMNLLTLALEHNEILGK